MFLVKKTSPRSGQGTPSTGTAGLCICPQTAHSANTLGLGLNPVSATLALWPQATGCLLQEVVLGCSQRTRPASHSQDPLAL